MNSFGFAQDTDDACVTIVPNAFINHFMVRARGDYVKVYLYGLKYCSNPCPPFPSNLQIASDLNLTESDVINAWKYWKDQNLIDIESDGDGMSITYVNMISYVFTSKASRDKKKGKQKVEERTPRMRAMFSDIEALTGKPVNADCATAMLEWIDSYHFSPETAILIVSDSLKRGKGDLRYWEKVAEDFSRRGITRYDEAVAYILERDSQNAELREVLNYLGLFRNPSTPERRAFAKWKTDFAFDKETILKACDQVSKPTIQNVDIILTAWNSGEEPERAAKRYVSRSNQRVKLQNDHDYDFDELEEILFGD
ncbi:MAG: DnaD domain protein [Eubacteriaceae bacterium]|jgi:hypothetical protein|nr:DnaD domain protein [Eubacteriaceae bacterium]